MNSTDVKTSRFVQASVLQGLSICGVTVMALMIAIGVGVGDASRISIAVLIQWLSGCQMANGCMLPQKIPVSQRTFKIPIISAILGLLIPK
jgi:hypothetical protein